MATIRPYYPMKQSAGKRYRSEQADGWLLSFKDHTGKWREKVYRGDRESADILVKRLESEAYEISAGLRKAPEQNQTLAIAIEEYLYHLRRTGRAIATVDRYSKTYKVFKRIMPHDICIQDIKRRDIERFRIARLESVTKAGVNIDLRQLRAFFNWCYAMEYINRSPLVGVKISVDSKPVRFLTRDEIKALLEVTRNDKNAHDLIIFYLSTGARATEILPPRFTWANVHQDEVVLIGKGNKVRHLGLNDTLKEILESRKYLKAPFPFSYDGVFDKIVRKYYRHAGIFEADLHTLRKTAGALLIQSGVDIYRVSKFLGHSSVTVTERHYVDILNQDYQRMAEIVDASIKSAQETIRKFQPIPDQMGTFQGIGDNAGRVDIEAFSRRETSVPGAGLEPAQLIQPGDFKSPVSTNSTTPALRREPVNEALLRRRPDSNR